MSETPEENEVFDPQETRPTYYELQEDGTADFLESSEFFQELSNSDKDELRSIIQKQEDTRSLLAKVLIGLLCVSFGLIIVLAAIVLFAPVPAGEQKRDRYEYSKDVVSILVTTQSGLVGAVLGFYFGSRSESNGNE